MKWSPTRVMLLTLRKLDAVILASSGSAATGAALWVLPPLHATNKTAVSPTLAAATHRFVRIARDTHAPAARFIRGLLVEPVPLPGGDRLERAGELGPRRHQRAEVGVG